jgi:hypothetical protein
MFHENFGKKILIPYIGQKKKQTTTITTNIDLFFNDRR